MIAVTEYIDYTKYAIERHFELVHSGSVWSHQVEPTVYAITNYDHVKQMITLNLKLK